MSERSTKPYILVGVDGSPSSQNALRWAAHEASLRNVPLRLVHAVDASAFAMGFDLGASPSFFNQLDAVAEQILEESVSLVREQYPDAVVATMKASTRPIIALREQSRGALLTVLGSSGLGTFGSLLAGSVSVSLSAHGHSPVVIVRGPELRTEGPVVLGVSGGPEGEQAIDWAFEEASFRGAELIAVHVWKYLPANFYYSFEPWEDPDQVPETERELLAERLAGWQDRFPDVTVNRVVTTGRPTEVLLEHAEHAQLVVTGSRGHGDAAGLLLGSTSHALIHRSACPVLVARPGD